MLSDNFSNENRLNALLWSSQKPPPSRSSSIPMVDQKVDLLDL